MRGPDRPVAQSSESSASAATIHLPLGVGAERISASEAGAALGAGGSREVWRGTTSPQR